MDAFVDRFSYAPTETEGVLSVAGRLFATIERPWIPGSSPGGMPFESCVPDGEYELRPWVRPSGEECWILVNEKLGVYAEERDIDVAEARFLCLVHMANFASEVVGCVAPGLKRVLMENRRSEEVERAVSSSGATMRELVGILGRDETHRLIVRPRCGTRSHDV